MKAKTLAVTDASKRAQVMQAVCLASVAALTLLILTNNFPLTTAFAGGEEAAKAAVAVILKILDTICIVLGAFFLIFGVVKVAIAHANDQGAEQNKALTLAATGLVLVLLGTVVLGELEEQITSLILSAIQ